MLMLLLLLLLLLPLLLLLADADADTPVSLLVQARVLVKQRAAAIERRQVASVADAVSCSTPLARPAAARKSAANRNAHQGGREHGHEHGHSAIAVPKQQGTWGTHCIVIYGMVHCLHCCRFRRSWPQTCHGICWRPQNRAAQARLLLCFSAGANRQRMTIRPAPLPAPPPHLFAAGAPRAAVFVQAAALPQPDPTAHVPPRLVHQIPHLFAAGAPRVAGAVACRFNHELLQNDRADASSAG